MKTEALKEEARKYEQREEWGKALELYLQAIESHSEEEEPEIALHNRVGDLRVRVGDLHGAVKHYERAIDLYLDAGLPNNAIAVCRKIIRNEPRRPDPFLRMGRIRAGQGFVVDARQNFLTFVEMVQVRGKAEEALGALEELALLTPADGEVRELLAERLLSAGRTEEGLTELSDGYRIFALTGSESRAERILGRLRELAPDRPPPSLELPLPSLEEPSEATDEVLGFETTSLDREESPHELMAGLESTAVETEDEEADASAGGVAWASPHDEVGEEEVEDEELSGEEEGTELATLEEPEEDETPLPYLESDVDDIDTPLPDLLAALRARVGRDPAEGEGWLLLGRELFEFGDVAEALAALERAQAAFSEAGEETAAERVAEELRALDPGRVDTGEIAPLPTAPIATAEVSTPPPPGGYVDLGALVLDEAAEETTRWTVSADAPTTDEDADFRKMLAQFKEKVAENLSADDAKAHYDLGTAYKEMGLVDEAIGEFQQSLRADPGSLATFEMLGQCFLDKGEPRATIRTLDRALRLPVSVEDDLLGIYYFLATAHEAVGNPEDAKEFYERIFALDINFKDVTDRLRELR